MKLLYKKKNKMEDSWRTCEEVDDKHNKQHYILFHHLSGSEKNMTDFLYRW